MWLKILISLIPVEKIVAYAFDYLLKKIEKKSTPALEKQVKKIVEASVAFKECSDDPDGAGRRARAAIKAWAKGEKTPNVWEEKKCLTET